jgi:predicted aspartyl protease
VPVITGRASGEDRPIIRLLARMTEARAEALRESGREPETREILALIDTGATESFLERTVAEGLGLDPIGEVAVHGVTTAGGPETGIVYRVRLFHAGVPAVEFASATRMTAVESLARFGVHMLLGRDLLARGILVYNGPDERFSFAF